MTATYNFSTTAADLWGSSSDGLQGTDTKFFVGYNGGGGSKVKVWIPFNVTLPKSITITAATLLIVGETTRSDNLSLKWGCEAVDSASAPASWADLNAKSMTTAFTTGDIATNVVAGTQYQLDITTAVQEILNRSGWTYNNVMACMIWDDGTSVGDFHRFAMFEHATHTEPILQISIPSPIPRGGMI